MTTSDKRNEYRYNAYKSKRDELMIKYPHVIEEYAMWTELMAEVDGSVKERNDEPFKLNGSAMKIKRRNRKSPFVPKIEEIILKRGEPLNAKQLEEELIALDPSLGTNRQNLSKRLVTILGNPKKRGDNIIRIEGSKPFAYTHIIKVQK